MKAIAETKFDIGEIVWHKLTQDRGIINSVVIHADGYNYKVTWETKEITISEEYELVDQEEYETIKAIYG